MVTDFLGAWRRLTFGGRDHHTLWYDLSWDGIQISIFEFKKGSANTLPFKA